MTKSKLKSFISSATFAMLTVAMAFALVLSLGLSEKAQAETSFNAGFGIVQADGLLVGKNYQATTSVGVEQTFKDFWIGADASLTTAEKVLQTGIGADAKVGLAFSQYRPYIAVGYDYNKGNGLKALNVDRGAAYYGIGLRYDLTKSFFLDASYKKSDSKDNSVSAKVHYKF